MMKENEEFVKKTSSGDEMWRLKVITKLPKRPINYKLVPTFDGTLVCEVLEHKLMEVKT
jgi:hypothetical protein